MHNARVFHNVQIQLAKCVFAVDYINELGEDTDSKLCGLAFLKGHANISTYFDNLLQMRKRRVYFRYSR